MVVKTFPAFDNEAFTVADDSPFGNEGDPIINHSDTPVGMIFTFSDGFPYQTISVEDTLDPDVFNDDEEQDHIIIDGKGIVADGTEVESESYHYVRLLDDNGDPTGPRITITVFSKGGVTQDVWGMASDTELIDGADYVKVGGSIFGDSEYDEFVPCFTPGTGILTPYGQVLIEELRPGQRVITRDHGAQRITWIGEKYLSGDVLRARPEFRPVMIRKGALGHGAPAQDMMVSPNHRVLLSEASFSVMFSTQEVLVAAKHLVGRPGIETVMTPDLRYIHVMFEQHEILLSGGSWTESFQPGAMAMAGVGAAQRREITALFPELDQQRVPAAFEDARPSLKSFESRLIGGLVS